MFTSRTSEFCLQNSSWWLAQFMFSGDHPPSSIYRRVPVCLTHERSTDGDDSLIKETYEDDDL